VVLELSKDRVLKLFFLAVAVGLVVGSAFASYGGNDVMDSGYRARGVVGLGGGDISDASYLLRGMVGGWAGQPADASYKVQPDFAGVLVVQLTTTTTKTSPTTITSTYVTTVNGTATTVTSTGTANFTTTEARPPGEDFAIELGAIALVFVIFIIYVVARHSR